jgi:hypothetical protein
MDTGAIVTRRVLLVKGAVCMEVMSCTCYEPRTGWSTWKGGSAASCPHDGASACSQRPPCCWTQQQ